MSYVWSDTMILEALHLREVLGYKTPHVAELMSAMTGFHISKSAICGLMFRINGAADKESYRQDGTMDFCQDGSMKPRWWDTPRNDPLQ